MGEETTECTCPRTDGYRMIPRRTCLAHAEQDAETGHIVAARRGGKNLRMVAWFNEVCPVGSPVFYWPGAREGEPTESVTRSEAWLLGGHTPVVMVEGYPGGIALSHVMGSSPGSTVGGEAETTAQEATGADLSAEQGESGRGCHDDSPGRIGSFQ